MKKAISPLVAGLLAFSVAQVGSAQPLPMNDRQLDAVQGGSGAGSGVFSLADALAVLGARIAAARSSAAVIAVSAQASGQGTPLVLPSLPASASETVRAVQTAAAPLLDAGITTATVNTIRSLAAQGGPASSMSSAGSSIN